MNNLERRQLNTVVRFICNQYGIAKERENDRDESHDYYLGLRCGYENVLRLLLMVGLINDEHILDEKTQNAAEEAK